MSALVIEMPVISDYALQVMQAVFDENEKTKTITNKESGPTALAIALSDFFELASGLEHQGQELDGEVASELAYHAIDLVDRLSYQLRQLDIHDQRDNLAHVFASLAVWFARRGAVLDNLDGVADSFANLINGEDDANGLRELNAMVEEVLMAAAQAIQQDEDKSNPWRPWRVLNLNAGIAATRSLDTGLMQLTFEKLELRLPQDVAGFFADGKRQMDAQDVPQDVRDVMDQFAGKWPAPGQPGKLRLLDL